MQSQLRPHRRHRLASDRLLPEERAGEWLAGLTGYTWGGWMHVNFLWVTEALRGQRHGSRLMDAAESFAVERGCIGSTLETHSFQAPGFYSSRGYEVFGTLEDYPPGHSKVFLRKRLAQS